MPRLALLLPLAICWIGALSMMDVLPGGWGIRNALEAPASREARGRAEHAGRREAAFKAEDVPDDAVVFVGSSTIERFPLRKSFPGAAVANRGIGGERANALIARLRSTLPQEPAGIIVYSGATDLYGEGSGTAAVAGLVKKVLLSIHELHPEVPRALIGVLPSQDPAQVNGRRELNAMLATMSQEMGVAWITAERSELVLANGCLSSDHAADRLHLDARGYAVLTRLILEQGGEAARRLR